jgi:hypothetical protein
VYDQWVDNFSIRQALAANAARMMHDFTLTVNHTTWDAWYWRAWRYSAPVAVSVREVLEF